MDDRHSLGYRQLPTSLDNDLFPHLLVTRDPAVPRFQLLLLGYRVYR